MLSGLFELLKGTSTAITLQVSAAYDSAKGWTFTAEQTQGTLKLLQFITTYLGGNFTFSHDLDLKGLKLELSPGVKAENGGEAIPSSYSFSVETAKPFTIDFLDLSVAGSVEITYTGASETLPAPRPAVLLPLSARAHAALERRGQRLPMLAAARLQQAVAADSGGFSGSLALQVLWHGVGLNVTYDFTKPGEDQTQKVTLALLFDGNPFAHAEARPHRRQDQGDLPVRQRHARRSCRDLRLLGDRPALQPRSAVGPARSHPARRVQRHLRFRREDGDLLRELRADRDRPGHDQRDRTDLRHGDEEGERLGRGHLPVAERPHPAGGVGRDRPELHACAAGRAATNISTSGCSRSASISP